MVGQSSKLVGRSLHQLYRKLHPCYALGWVIFAICFLISAPLEFPVVMTLSYHKSGVKKKNKKKCASTVELKFRKCYGMEVKKK